MRTFTTAERRNRLAVRHHLAPGAKRADVAEVADDLIGLHGTDPASIFLSAAARMKRPHIESIERALYDDRTIVRMLAMRRTLFVVPVDLVPMVQAAASDAVAATERKKLLRWIDEAGITPDAAKWLRRVSAKTLAIVRELGSGTSTEIAEHVPELRRKIVLAPNTKWGTEQPIGTRVVPLLGVEGRIARGRPRGSWISTQHRWEPIENWLPGGLERVDADEARVQLVTRWLRAFGPAPISDLQWWTKWTLRDTRVALAAADVTEVDIEGVLGIALADDLETSKPVRPWVALLPSLDPTVMGWQERTWFIGAHAREVFDRAGNAGATVWSDGRVVGTWAQLPGGEIVWRLFEDVGSEAKAAIAKEAERLRAWVGATRFTPRFGPRWTAE
ncbi:MAG: hypothetical protein QOI95_444 [Acidimicrobiaceae bacterium]|jgi:hypothetical protein